MTENHSRAPRVALVTGANKGIGLETVRRLVDGGFEVYLAARDETRGRAAAAEVGATPVVLDVGSDESVDHAADLVRLGGGHLDLLVNNAGITGPLRDVHDYTAGDISEVLLTNVAGYVRVMHAFLSMLEESTDPRIVNVSSGLGSFALFHDLDGSKRPPVHRSTLPRRPPSTCSPPGTRGCCPTSASTSPTRA